MDVLESVIGLGPNIFYGATLAACILVFRANKPDSKKGKVLFIDASDQVRVGRAQNYLEADQADKIYSWYSDFKNAKNHAKVASLKDIASNGWSLNIPLYVEKTDESTLPSVKESTVNFKQSLEDVWQSEAKLKKILKDFSLLTE